MEDQKYRIRVCLLDDFKQGKSVWESHSSILKLVKNGFNDLEKETKLYKIEGVVILLQRSTMTIFSKGIRDLQEKWRKTIANNGEYLLD